MKHRFLVCCAMLLTTAGFTTAQAEDEEWDGRFYLAPALTYNFFDEDLGVEDSAGGHLSFGKPITSFMNAELQLSYVDAKDSSASAEITAFGVDLMFFPSRGRTSIFGLIGYMESELEATAGAASADLDGSILDFGVGLLRRVNEHGTALRAEYRYREHDADVIEFEDHVLMLGVQFPLGSKDKPAPPPPPPPPPPPTPEPEPEPEPLVRLEGVHFEFDSANLTDSAKVLLDKGVEAMNTRTDIEVIVIGHTCNLGPKEYNKQLSERRAESVRNYMVESGISADRLQSRGYGEEHPEVSNATKEGRAQNRRVEVTIVDDRLCLPPLEGDSVDENGCAVID